MNRTASIIIIISLVVGIGIIFAGVSSSRNNVDTSTLQEGQNVEIKDGVQYIKIDARGGYFPRVTTAQAGIPTKLIMNTKGTYDCSASLVIRSLKYQEILPQNGETVIDVGVPVAGEPLQGVCGMGMYSFSVNFI
jgi:plastocyanin domain-containing protein